jgi:hypothetical protein
MSTHQSPSRRTFLKYMAGATGLILAGGMADQADSESAPILVNHVGYTPQAPKVCLTRGLQPTPFVVIDTATGNVVYRGMMLPQPSDLGPYVAGDFGQLQQPGTYQLATATRTSQIFAIAAGIYDSSLEHSITYFSKQRCGNSTSGYHTPCHIDDGVRLDNGQHQDVVGGWHDACDLRKWVDSTIYGMIGLSRLPDLMPAGWNNAQIIDELRWGNRYFRKMQEPAGYVMDYCGGDDGNYFTDNIIGTSDDRKIHTEPTSTTAQFDFILAQAGLARQVASSDAQYAQGCLAAANACLNWVTANSPPTTSTSLGAAIIALLELNRATPNVSYRALASQYAKQLMGLQLLPGPHGSLPISGFFLMQANNTQPEREIQDGNQPLLALCSLLEQMPNHADAAYWRTTLTTHTEYLLAMAGLSAFGIVPFGLYAGANPGGGRRIGGYFYRYFMKFQGEYANDPTWWVGINAHLASNGIGLSRAGKLLQNLKLTNLAQRHLDWILGTNPFNASTVVGSGKNQPQLYHPGAFTPATPLMNGGVMNGIGGDANDQPLLTPGSWQNCEYWTPMTAYTTWLMAQLQSTSA